MPKALFNIGDLAWVPDIMYEDTYVTCPVCCGNLYVTVIWGDGTEYTVDCDECVDHEHYRTTPTGKVKGKAIAHVVARQIRIDGVRTSIDDDTIYWSNGTGYRYVFPTEEAAMSWKVEVLNQPEKDPRVKNMSYVKSAQYLREQAQHNLEVAKRYRYKMHRANDKIKRKTPPNCQDR